MFKLILALGIKYAKYKIIEIVMVEFIKRKLGRKYAKDIEAWQKYLREKKFTIKLTKQTKNEIKRFQETVKQWKPKELEEFIIEGLDCLE